MSRQQRPARRQNKASNSDRNGFGFEGLENRQLLSAAHWFGPPIGGRTILFDQAPLAVQTGLDNLASTDSVAAPTSTQNVFLSNSNGVETYSVDITGTGTNTVLTVDVKGNPVTAATHSTTTFGAIGNALVTNEFNAIATALGLTAPASTATVQVLTPSSGNTVYTINLSGGSSHWGQNFSVDSAGNPVGNANIPFSAMPTAIQNGLITNEPAGVTLTTSSTQTVHVQTIDGVTLYTMFFHGSGTFSMVTVDVGGSLASLPSQSSTQFGSLSTLYPAAAAELQILATDDGVTGTISPTQTVRSYTEPNGTTVYTVVLSDSSSQWVVISVDEDGNPTVPPGLGRGIWGFMAGPIFGGFGFGGFGFGRRW